MDEHEGLPAGAVLGVMRCVAEAAAAGLTPAGPDAAGCRPARWLTGLAEVAGADQAWCLWGHGVRRDGPAPTLAYACSHRADPGYLARYARAMDQRDPRRADPMIRHFFDTPGARVSAGLDQVLQRYGRSTGGRAWAKALADSGVHDLHAETRRLGGRDDAILGLSFHRLRPGRFTPQHRAAMRLAATELARAVGVDGAPPNAVAAEPLPPRLAQVLDLLLAGRAPRAIAAEMGISLNTVREHQKRLYRHFRVDGRAALTAAFRGLDRPNADRSATP